MIGLHYTANARADSTTLPYPTLDAMDAMDAWRGREKWHKKYYQVQVPVVIHTLSACRRNAGLGLPHLRGCANAAAASARSEVLIQAGTRTPPAAVLYAMPCHANENDAMPRHQQRAVNTHIMTKNKNSRASERTNSVAGLRKANPSYVHNGGNRTTVSPML